MRLISGALSPASLWPYTSAGMANKLLIVEKTGGYKNGRLLQGALHWFTDYLLGRLREYIEQSTPVSIYGGAGLQCAG
jgi:hypothetical protein